MTEEERALLLAMARGVAGLLRGGRDSETMAAIFELSKEIEVLAVKIKENQLQN